MIDFWLCRLILPVQAKQFPQKLVSTAGDLCRNKELVQTWQTITTGFSGTDDLSLVLPPTVRQVNLSELEKTNGLQLRSILRPENNVYFALKSEKQASANFTVQLLALLEDSERRSNVVLDSGALVLHLNNVDFSINWLKCRPEMEACVFFDGDRVYYVTQNDEGRSMPFFGSPYAGDMSKCLLYLDDVHTRGSDFNLPLKTRAIVTLGKGMTKDKFVQTCMRMRQLGMSQALTFVAAPDVDSQLRNKHFQAKDSTGPEILVPRGVLDWTVSNTVKRICDLLPYFVSQAVSTLRKASMFEKHYYAINEASHDNSSIEAFAQGCVERETLLLHDMYGHQRGIATLPEVGERQLNSLPPTSNSGIVNNIRSRMLDIAPHVLRHCSMLDEEQERELEQEIEEERQVERPPPATPLQSKVSPELKKLFSLTKLPLDGGIDNCFTNVLGFTSLSTFLQQCSMCAKIKKHLSDVNVYCTGDFVHCVKGSGHKDSYLKQFRWVLLVQTPNNEHPVNMHNSHTVVIISNFEAEAFHHLVGRGDDASHRTILSFAAVRRRGQPLGIFRNISTKNVHEAVHVFGGSLHADDNLMEKIRTFLAICPRPVQHADAWDRLFRQGKIERDGFVPELSRELVEPSLSQSPFSCSPVCMLLSFLSNARDASEELPSSALGHLLGASEIEQE